MPLSTRELFLVLRARDEASRTLSAFSRNLRDVARSSGSANIEASNAVRQRIRAEQLATATTLTGYQSTINALQRQRILQGGLEREDYQRLELARLASTELRQQSATRLRNIRAEAQAAADMARLEAARAREQAELQQQLIARHQALGNALVGVGVASSFAGTAGLKFLYDNTQAAVAYDKQVRLTATQVDKQRVSLKQLGDIGIRVADQIGAPFEELQGSLYDIFSSMDVSVRDSEKLLKAFAKTAVAGQVNIATAGRTTIAIMNAFRLPIRDVNKVMDFQFQLVRKGIGTYEQFATTIGRSIPSAARAGQTYQQLGGMLAFLTRNGLSAAMASASAGRALDAISNAKTVKNLKDLGDIVQKSIGKDAFAKVAKAAGVPMQKFLKDLSVNAVDAKGKFRPLVDIIAEMQRKLQGLTDPQRAAALQELFKGAGGTIQARRFFDLVLKNSKMVAAFRTLTQDMYHATGAADQAYKTMADSAATRTQLLKNRWQIFKVQLGEQFLPVLVQLIGALSKLLGIWQGLNPHVRRFLGWTIAIGAILALIVGVVVAVTGAFVLLAAAAAASGIGLAALIGIGAAVAAAVALVIAAVILSIKYWDELKAAFTVVRDWLVSKLTPAFQAFAQWFSTNLMPIVRDVVDFFKSKWEELKAWWDQLWPSLTLIAHVFWKGLQELFRAGVEIVKTVWHIFGDTLVRVIQGAWELIKGVIGGALQIIEGIIAIFIGIFTLRWGLVWEGVKKIAAGAWSIIQGIFKAAFDVLLGALGAFGRAASVAWQATQRAFGTAVAAIIRYALIPLVNGVLWMAQQVIHAAVLAFGWVPGLGDKLRGAERAVTNFRSNVVSEMQTLANKAAILGMSAGSALGDGFSAGIDSKGAKVSGSIANLAERAKALKTALAVFSPSKITFYYGKMYGEGFALGIESMYARVNRTIKRLGSASQIESTTRATLAKLRTVANNTVDRTADAAARDFARSNARLIALAKQRDGITARLKSAQASLNKLVSDKKEYVQKVTDQVREFGNVSGAGGGNIEVFLQDRLTQIRNFQQNIRTLQQQGLNRTTLDQIIQAGVEQGGAAARSLLGSGPDVVKRVNDLQKQIDAAATGLGQSAGSVMFDAGIKTAQGLVKGLQSQQAAITKIMMQVAAAMVAVLKRELRIKSPSAVFRYYGQMVGEGLALGHMDKLGRVMSTSRRLAEASRSGYSPGGIPLGATYASNGRTGPVQVSQTFHLHGVQNINPLKHSADLGWMIAQRVGA